MSEREGVGDEVVRERDHSLEGRCSRACTRWSGESEKEGVASTKPALGVSRGRWPKAWWVRDAVGRRRVGGFTAVE